MEIKIDGNKVIVSDDCIIERNEGTITIAPRNNDKVVERWEDLSSIEGFSIDFGSNIQREFSRVVRKCHSGIAKTEKHCKAMLAMAKISQLKPHYGGDITVLEWANSSILKYVIYWDCSLRRFNVCMSGNVANSLVAFHSQEQAERFIKNNRSLLLDYFMVELKINY